MRSLGKTYKACGGAYKPCGGQYRARDGLERPFPGGHWLQVCPYPIEALKAFPGDADILDAGIHLPASGSHMSIASIQSLIQKYAPNFNKTDAKAQDGKADSGKGSDSASSSASGSQASDKDTLEALGVLKTSAKDAKGDTVSLSPQAMEYLAAHTGPKGKFEVPNMMDYFLNPDQDSEASGDSLANLADLLRQSRSADKEDPLSSLGGFL
jgi:hypothetical protein